MGERSDQIEQQIYRTRGELNENFNELEEKVRSTFDWRTQFEQRPFTLLALAFGGGLLASALLPTRARRRNRYRDARSTASPQKDIRAATAQRPAPTNNGTLDAFKGALIGVAAKRFGGAIGDFFSDYRDELRQTRHTRNAHPV
jgi:hypothetical protein